MSFVRLSFRTLAGDKGFSQCFKAFLLTLWSGDGCYVRPFFDGMAALRPAPYFTPSEEML
jgi:hypothetical protein